MESTLTRVIDDLSNKVDDPNQFINRAHGWTSDSDHIPLATSSPKMELPPQVSDEILKKIIPSTEEWINSSKADWAKVKKTDGVDEKISLLDKIDFEIYACRKKTRMSDS